MTITTSRTDIGALIDRLRAGARLDDITAEERYLIRKAVDATQRDIAAVLGVSSVSVSYWERQVSGPGPRHRVGYLRILEEFAELARVRRSTKTQK